MISLIKIALDPIIALWLITYIGLLIRLLDTCAHVSGTKDVAFRHFEWSTAFIHGYSLRNGRKYNGFKYARNSRNTILLGKNGTGERQENSRHTKNINYVERKNSPSLERKDSLYRRMGTYGKFYRRHHSDVSTRIYNYRIMSRRRRPSIRMDEYNVHVSKRRFNDELNTRAVDDKYVDRRYDGRSSRYTPKRNNFSHGRAQYERMEITQNDLDSLPLLTPGIRDIRNAQEDDPAADGIIKELQKKGFDGIVDMNSLFGISHTVFGGDGSTFESIGIYDKFLLGALNYHGITQPTLTQKNNIPKVIDMFKSGSKDVETCFINAVTGSGKTLAYLLPIMQDCLNSKLSLSDVKSPESKLKLKSFFTENIIVFCPSTELCVQTRDAFNRIYNTYIDIKGQQGTCLDHKSGGNTYISRIFSSILGKAQEPSSSTEIDVTNRIVPILLITQANLKNQENALKSLRKQQDKDILEATHFINGTHDHENKSLVRRIGLFFTDFRRAHILSSIKNVLAISDIKYAVIDEYDGHISSKPSMFSPNMEKEDIVERVLKNLLSARKLSHKCKNENAKGDHTRFLINLSASHFNLKVPLGINKLGDPSTEKNNSANPDNFLDLPETILHTVITVRPDSKLSTLTKLLKTEPCEKSVLLVCGTAERAEFLYHHLSGVFPYAKVDLINGYLGNLKQKLSFKKVLGTNIRNTVGAHTFEDNKRQGAIKSTRFVKNILVSDPWITRGIDLAGFTHIINYDVPHGLHNYVHISGRIGRAGNPGLVINMVGHRFLPVFTRAISNRLPKTVYPVDVYKGHLCVKGPIGDAHS